MVSDELRRKRALLRKNTNITLNNMQRIADESYRVANIAANAENILDDLDKKFEEKTDLQYHDMKFLFVAVCFQLARIYILNELTKKEKAGHTNRNESKLHSIQKKILKKFNCNGNIKDEPYYASMEHIITTTGVPYDANETLTEESIDKIRDLQEERKSLIDLVMELFRQVEELEHRLDELYRSCKEEQWF